MPNREVHPGSFDWISDPNAETIDEIIARYEKNKAAKLPEGFGEYNIDLEEDPDISEVLEFLDSFIDPKDNAIRENKIIKNWEYFSKPQENMDFYREKAKYIMRNYSRHKDYFEDYKNGRTKKEMSNEMFEEVLGNVRFFEQCLNNELVPYYLEIHFIYVSRMSYRAMEEVTEKNRGSIENNVKKAVDLFARLLIAKDQYKFYGKKIFDHGIDHDENVDNVVFNEKLEIVGKLAMHLIAKIKELDKK